MIPTSRTRSRSPASCPRGSWTAPRSRPRCCTIPSRTPAPPCAELERLFGAEVARLVDGVTKLNKLELQSSQTEQAENFRKLLLAMSEDIRVLLVKLADRLHNMRTLNFIRKADKRRRIAAETMEIYAPLAERIGMQALKDELEDLAFAALWPDARASRSATASATCASTTAT